MSGRVVLGVLVVLMGAAEGLVGQAEIRIGDERRAGLEEVRAECELVGRMLIRRIELAFHNDGSRAAEGELVCPLQAGERIVSYAMDVGGVRREGVVVPAKAGREAYEEIVRRQVDPGILEVDEEKGEFRTRVFPIPKGGEKRVWITTLTIVGDGEVPVWVADFGQPKSWSLAVRLRGGERTGEAPGWKFVESAKGDWNSKRDGRGSAMSGCTVHWSPNDGVIYRSPDGDGGSWLCHLGRGHPVKPHPADPTVAVWFDGSGALTDQAAAGLEALLTWIRAGTIRLQVFRDDLSPVEEFEIAEGQCAPLMQRLRGEKSRGMARPGKLPWQAPGAELIVLLTDGQFPEGPGVVGRPALPMHVIDSGAGRSEWLRTRAVASGGGWHADGGLDPLVGMRSENLLEGVLAAEAKFVRGIYGEVVAAAAHTLEELATEVPVVDTPAAHWVWAQMMSAELRASGTDAGHLATFRHRHGVMGESSAWLVLETARDYAHYGFEPPLEEKALRKEWRGFLQKKESNREAALDRLATRWKERCKILEREQVPPGEAVLDSVAGRIAFWLRQTKLQEDLEVAEVRPLVKLLGQVESLTDGEIGPAEGKRLMNCLERLETHEEELRAKLKVVQITVGGMVRRPGQLERLRGSTLHEAILAAGGATEFGATNRVKLYRNGQVYSYDMRKEAHRNLRIEGGDTIDVPQKHWLGNGGGKPGQKPPFVEGEPGRPTLRIAAAPWDPDRPYVRVLDEIMKAGGDWSAVYAAQRSVHGWRADFYLDCLELMERRGLRDEARRVAGELAELDPESIELLRRAARALRRLGDDEASAALFAHILSLAPDDEIALYDVARSAMQAGDHARAVRLLWKAVREGDDSWRKGRPLVFLEELNALLVREKLRPETFGIEPRFLHHVPLDLRVVLEWDAEQCNVDLFVRTPMQNPLRAPGEVLTDWYVHSGNVSRGFGPESFCVRRAIPGNYRFKARFHGDWNESAQSRVTAELEVIRHFGTEAETRERFGIRLDEQRDREILQLMVVPAGWE
jgi:hypothetical protein